ncbi:MAG: class I SAM-dependent methyltransferase [Clostridium sp.]
MKNIKTDWSQRAKTYNNIKWVNDDKTLSSMIEFCGNINKKKILDLGTGTGKVLKMLKKHFPDGDFYGVDISKDMMKRMDKKNEFKLELSAIEDLKIFDDNTFDVLTARMVFHHSENLNKAMSEAYRVLKPNGRLIICEGTPPNKECIDFYTEMFKYKEERHTFLLDDITNLMINNGFEKIMSETIVSRNMSLNNWVDNAGISQENVNIIKNMHFDAYKNEILKNAYDMKLENNDMIMNWKFAVVCAVK